MSVFTSYTKKLCSQTTLRAGSNGLRQRSSIVRDGADLKDKRRCLDRSSGLFLTCGKKQGQSHIYSQLLCSLLINQKVCFLTHITVLNTNLSSQMLSALQQMSPSLLLSQSRLSLLTHNVKQYARQLPTDGLAWLFFLKLGLPRSCC